MSFIDYLNTLSLSNKTLDTHKRKYKLIQDHRLTNPTAMMEYLQLQPLSAGRATASTMSKYLTYMNIPNQDILTYMNKTHQALKAPTPYKHLIHVMNQQTERAYVILFLCIKKQATSRDMIATVVSSNTKRDEKKNYIVRYPKYAIWFRPTANGMRMDKITDKLFLNALTTMSYVFTEEENQCNYVKTLTNVNVTAINQIVEKHRLATWAKL